MALEVMSVMYISPDLKLTPSNTWRRRALCVLVYLSSSVTLWATPSAPSSERPPLMSSFSSGELSLTTGAILGLGLLTLKGDDWLGPRGASMGAPVEGSNDLRFSRWASPDFDPKAQWLGGAPDLLGYVAPALTLTYYVGGSALSGGVGVGGARPHEALAFSEGLSWAMFSTTLLKHLVGRKRPYIARGERGELDATAVNMSESEQLLSFPSGHATAIAATSFFLAADVSDALVSGPLRSSGAVSRALLGRVLPYASAAGLSWLVMYSRIKDQRHWLSDTLTGGLIGMTSALLSYHLHFDSYGEPYTQER